LDYLTATESRLICAALTATASLIVYLNIRSVRIRMVIWSILILIGIANALSLNLKQSNIVHANLIHHYLGAKYDCSYSDFYKLVTAALEMPQISYRDLKNSPAMFRADPREHRLYYQELLTKNRISFSALEPLEHLRELCISEDLVKKEASDILRDGLRPEEITGFKRDVKFAAGKWKGGRSLAGDYGFNGSPLYVLARQMDPGLWFPLTTSAGYINICWQIIAVFIITFLAGKALGWAKDDSLFAAALVLASQDFTGWALPGLILAGWLLPVMATLWAFRRPNVAASGFGIAWAGLIKLFPFVLALPLILRVVKAHIFTRRILVQSKKYESAGKQAVLPSHVLALRILLVCLALTVILTALSSLTGRSWAEFLHKITLQFQSPAYFDNSVSLSQAFLKLGIAGSPAIILPRLTMLFAICWVIWMSREKDFWQTLPLISLVLLSCMAWFAHTWFNYYSIITLFLLPGLLRSHRRMVVLFLILFAASFSLPEYDDACGHPFEFLSIMKVIVPLLLPVYVLAMEVRKIRRLESSPSELHIPDRWIFFAGKFIIPAGFILSVFLVGTEMYRFQKANSYFQTSQILRQQGKKKEALIYFTKTAKLLPGNAQAQSNLASVHAENGNIEEAIAYFKKALALDPDNADVHTNLGTLYFNTGYIEQSIDLFSGACRLVPYDEQMHFNFGRAFLRQGKLDEAKALFNKALAINPNFEPAKRYIDAISARGAVTNNEKNGE